MVLHNTGMLTISFEDLENIRQALLERDRIMDSKDVWNAAYNSAIDDGKSEKEAVTLANDAVADHEAEQADATSKRKRR